MSGRLWQVQGRRFELNCEVVLAKDYPTYESTGIRRSKGRFRRVKVSFFVSSFPVFPAFRLPIHEAGYATEDEAQGTCDKYTEQRPLVGLRSKDHGAEETGNESNRASHNGSHHNALYHASGASSRFHT